ncbi:MAG: glycosyltransferase family 1 protein [Bacilli bacterium]
MKIEGEKNNPVRIAQIVGKWLGGGVEAVLMNYYREIDKSKIQFDFICDNDSTNIPYEEIERLGGKVILIPPYQKIFKYHKELKRVLKEGKYKIVHSHINTLSVFSLCAAWTAKVPVRIAHSHSTTNPSEKKKNLFKLVLRPFSKLYATNYMACTEHAGRWMFGNKDFENDKVFVLNNAIDLEKYSYNEKLRKKLRKELNVKEDNIVIGHIGRFVEQKNHKFIIEIFKKISDQNDKAVLLLIGQGPLMQKMKEFVSRLKLNEKVIFLGQKDNANEYYNAMDLFLFPSLYEGLGMVLIEAQVSGLSCIASTEVPDVAKITESVEFVDLNDTIDKWVKSVTKFFKNNKNRSTNLKSVTENGYNILEETKKLENYYLNRK